MEIEYENCWLVRFQKKPFSLSFDSSLRINSYKKDQTMLLKFQSYLSKLLNCALSIQYQGEYYPQIEFYKRHDRIFTWVHWFSLKCSESQLCHWYPKNNHSIDDWWRVLSCLHSHLSTICFQNGSVPCQGINWLKSSPWKGNWNWEWIWKGLSPIGSINWKITKKYDAGK